MKRCSIPCGWGRSWKCHCQKKKTEVRLKKRKAARTVEEKEKWIADQEKNRAVVASIKGKERKKTPPDLWGGEEGRKGGGTRQ